MNKECFGRLRCCCDTVTMLDAKTRMWKCDCRVDQFRTCPMCEFHDQVWTIESEAAGGQTCCECHAWYCRSCFTFGDAVIHACGSYTCDTCYTRLYK